MKKALKKEEKRSLKTGYGKFFRIEKNVERKNTSKKEKRYKHKKPKSKGRWVNALALYGEEGRDYLRKAATSWK